MTPQPYTINEQVTFNLMLYPRRKLRQVTGRIVAIPAPLNYIVEYQHPITQHTECRGFTHAEIERVCGWKTDCWYYSENNKCEENCVKYKI